jgi:hypothetical protein
LFPTPTAHPVYFMILISQKICRLFKKEARRLYDYIVDLLKESFQRIVDHKCTHIKPELLKKKVKKTILIK